ncbi:hypothetical protein BJ085DRAFT_12734, partial [Dimargaris cristalligena]
WKTELCHNFEDYGSCRRGSKCFFAHGQAELQPRVRHPRYQTQLCRTYWSGDFCYHGVRCHFIH